MSRQQKRGRECFIDMPTTCMQYNAACLAVPASLQAISPIMC